MDTNVLVRYLVQDDPSQSTAATQLIEGLSASEPGYLSTVTVVETSWVLTRAYKASRATFGDVLEGLLRSRELVLETPELHHEALAAFRASEADYADCVIALAGRRAGCAATVTFDRMAGASVMQLI